MAIYQFGDHIPHIAPTAYVSDTANIIGNVTLEANVSIWFGATVRGDNEQITIGERSNVQENCVLHTDPGYPLSIGRQVTIGHQAMLHGCEIGDGSLIGIQAVILNKAKVGKNCLVGAGALITEGRYFPDNSLILGSPAKAVRTLTSDETAHLAAINDSYVKRAEFCKTNLKRIDQP